MENTPAPTRSRWPLILLLGFLFLVVSVASLMTWAVSRSRSALAQAIAETDQLDSGWRLAEMDAARTQVPDANNAALAILDAQTALNSRKINDPQNPNGEIPSREVDAALREAPLGQLLPPNLLDQLRRDVQSIKAVLTAAHLVDQRTQARYPVVFDETLVSAGLTPLMGVRGVVNALTAEAALKAQEGDVDSALASCGTALRVGRTLRDTPILISYLVVVACRAVAIRQIERALALGQPSEAALAAVQKILQEDAADTLWLETVRGERAYQDAALASLRRTGAGGTRSAADIALDFFGPFIGNSPTTNHAAILRLANKWVEAARLPLEEQGARFKEITALMQAPTTPMLVRQTAPALEKTFEAHLRAQAELRCVIVMLAAERYRLAKRKWPEQPADLVPTYLPAVPKDPYSKGPILAVETQRGLTVYSVGPDGKGDGGTLDRVNLGRKGGDLGGELLDVSYRRQPAGKNTALPSKEQQP